MNIDVFLFPSFFIFLKSEEMGTLKELVGFLISNQFAEQTSCLMCHKSAWPLGRLAAWPRRGLAVTPKAICMVQSLRMLRYSVTQLGSVDECC